VSRDFEVAVSSSRRPVPYGANLFVHLFWFQLEIMHTLKIDYTSCFIVVMHE